MHIRSSDCSCLTRLKTASSADSPKECSLRLKAGTTADFDKGLLTVNWANTNRPVDDLFDLESISHNNCVLHERLNSDRQKNRDLVFDSPLVERT